jgi:hypothetical protein
MSNGHSSSLGSPVITIGTEQQCHGTGHGHLCSSACEAATIHLKPPENSVPVKTENDIVACNCF